MSWYTFTITLHTSCTQCLKRIAGNMDSQIIRHIFQEGKVSWFVKLAVSNIIISYFDNRLSTLWESANLRWRSHSLIFVIWVQNINVGMGVSVRDVQKILPLWRYVVQAVWPCSRMCRNLFVVPRASVWCQVWLGNHNGLCCVWFIMDDWFSTYWRTLKSEQLQSSWCTKMILPLQMIGSYW
jgi:hypothetical protein